MPFPALCLLICSLGLVFGINLFSGRVDMYVLDVTLGIGINVIMAVSLNLINGYTGQFSLGHAGFMAVGAYTSAAVTMFAGPAIIHGFGPAAPGWEVALVFLAALLMGGLVASLAGFIVGMPSLRLKGDYLAIVTLGFGEII